MQSMSVWQQESGNCIVASVSFDSLAEYSLWHPQTLVAVPSILSMLLQATEWHSSCHAHAFRWIKCCVGPEENVCPGEARIYH